MQWDNWAQQTYDVFKAVLSRPRFELTLAKEGIMPSGNKIAYFRAKTGDLIACLIIPGRFHSSVSAFEVSNLDSFRRQGKFKFQTCFGKAACSSMRKEALKLAKKISQKEVYDVMHA